MSKALRWGSNLGLVALNTVLLRLMCSENALTKFFANDQLFKAGVPTSIMQWAIVCALIAASASFAGSFFSFRATLYSVLINLWRRDLITSSKLGTFL